MNILVLNGSPKGTRSNSLRLTDAFIKGLCLEQENKGTQVAVEQVQLSKQNINSCKGCFVCWKNTPGKCCINDDMPMILEKILWADVIVYSFPLYYFNVPGTLKNMIDRQLPMVMPFMSERDDGVGSGSHEARFDMSKKRYMLISTCGFYSAEGNYDSVLKMYDHICGKDNYEYIFCGQGELFSVKELSARTDEYLSLVEKAGKEFANGRISEEVSLQLKQLLYPRDIFEKMADASWGVSRETGEKEDESLIFTRQMAALYNKDHFDGKRRVLQMHYTDIDKTYQIVLKDSGSAFLTEGFMEPTTCIETPYQVWVDIAQGKIRGDEALANQLYKVTGDFSLMLKWDYFFGVDAAVEVKAAKKDEKIKPPSMTTMLIAFITFFVAVSIDATTGAYITLGVSACIPLIMSRHMLIIYDKLAIAIVSLLSVLSLVTGQGALVVNIGYLLFGLMWLLSCVTKEPLCACYVKYNYNGEDALNNPIFMKTNYILAIAWGVLYVLTAIWTYVLNGTVLAGYLPIINNIMPILLGIFTGWFQNWYPAYVARGGR